VGFPKQYEVSYEEALRGGTDLAQLVAVSLVSEDMTFVDRSVTKRSECRVSSPQLRCSQREKLDVASRDVDASRAHEPCHSRQSWKPLHAHRLASNYLEHIVIDVF